MVNTLRITTIILLFFLGVTSILGGLGLMGDTTDSTISLPERLMESTIFDSYLLPGIILFLTVGVSSLFIAVMVIRKTPKYPPFIALQGMILLGWLYVELLINLDFFYVPLHLTYYLIGIGLVVLGVWITQLERQIKIP